MEDSLSVCLPKFVSVETLVKVSSTPSQRRRVPKI